MWPILSPFGLRTAVPSTRSLAISWCGFVMTSAITPSFWADEWNQRLPPKEVPSGRERFGSGLRIRKKRHCFELVVAGRTTPEIGRAVRAVFNPFRSGDRLAALCAGIFRWQIAEICSGHGASLPFVFCFEANWICFEANWTGLLPDKALRPVACNPSAAFCHLNGKDGRR